MSNEGVARYVGAQMRQALQSHYTVTGSDQGYRIARRVLFEVASCVAENHCIEDAVELCYRVGDRLSAGLPAAGATLFVGEELLPGPRAALARIEAQPDLDNLPVHTFDLGNREPAIITGDLDEAVENLRKLLAAIEATQPAPAPEPRWRGALRWIGGPNSWWALGGFWVGQLLGGIKWARPPL